jgi:quercetin dioxygenase-like cupin family protein
MDGPIEGYETLVVEIELVPGAVAARHTHPGIESGYLIEGDVELSVDGQAPRRLGPGDAFQVRAGAPHSARSFDRATKIVSTFVVEKGKPLASPA